CSQLVTTTAPRARPTRRGHRALIERARFHIVSIYEEAHRRGRQQRDLVTAARDAHRPLLTAHDLRRLGRDHGIVDEETAVPGDIDAKLPITDADLVDHRSASSRPARAHVPSGDATDRRVARPRVASTATSAAAVTALSSSAGAVRGGQWAATYPVP